MHKRGDLLLVPFPFAGDLVHGRLPAPSWICTDRIVTPGATLIVKSTGQAAAREFP